jgi:hypothetical protein
MVVGLDNSGKTTLLCGLKGVREKIERAASAQVSSFKQLACLATLFTPSFSI